MTATAFERAMLADRLREAGDPVGRLLRGEGECCKLLRGYLGGLTGHIRPATRKLDRNNPIPRESFEVLLDRFVGTGSDDRSVMVERLRKLAGGGMARLLPPLLQERGRDDWAEFIAGRVRQWDERNDWIALPLGDLPSDSVGGKSVRWCVHAWNAAVTRHSPDSLKVNAARVGCAAWYAARFVPSCRAEALRIAVEAAAIGGEER